MAEGDVFTDRTGNILIYFSDSGIAHDTSHEPSHMTGWRERASGVREPVCYVNGKWVSKAQAVASRTRVRKIAAFPGHFDTLSRGSERDPT
jgi:hypothetical protein